MPNGTDAQTVILMPVFTAKPESREKLALALRDLQELSREDDGCISYSVFVDVDDPQRFVLYEEWTTEPALLQHNQQAHVRDFVISTAGWLAEDFSVTKLKPLDRQRGAAPGAS
jgi:quinol monooxygenase YgiN